MGTEPRYADQLGDPAKLKLLPPLATYYLQLNLLDQGGTLESAALLEGFNYVVLSSEQAFANVTVVANNSGKAQSLRMLATGANIGDVPNALDQLRILDQLQSGSYEARLLSSPGLFRAIWLKSDPGGSDLIYIVAPAPPLEAGKLYTVEEFVKTILMMYHDRQNQNGFG